MSARKRWPTFTFLGDRVGATAWRVEWPKGDTAIFVCDLRSARDFFLSQAGAGVVAADGQRAERLYDVLEAADLLELLQR